MTESSPATPPEEFDDPFAEEEAEPAESAEPAEDAAPAAPSEGGAPLLAAAEEPPSGDLDAPHEPGADGLVAPVEGPEQSPDAGASEGGAPSESAPTPAPGVATRSADEPSTKPAAKASKPAPSPKDASSKDPSPEPQPDAAPPVADPPSPEPTTAPTEAKPAPPVVKEPPPPPPQARLVGTYRYAGGSSQRQRLKDAIDSAVQQLNALIRGIGRRRLNESNQIRDQIKISVDGDKVTTTFTPGGTLTTTLGAPAIPWTTDTGNAVKAKAKMVKGRLVQDFKSEDGARRSVYTLDKSGDTLTLSVTISSDRLPEPLKYALTYKRR